MRRRNRETILEAALDVFSRKGFRGATLDEIATAAGLSKPNLLYYFRSKEAIHTHLLDGILKTWLDPLYAVDPGGDPREEILGYVRGKLAMSRQYPRESRLFANEILQGAPHVAPRLTGELKRLVDEKAAVIRAWGAEGRLPVLDGHHLIISIWALTQHYADFEVQMSAVLGEKDPYPRAEAYLEELFSRMLTGP
ncbi:TetR family transcriptional regulator C-terminal domain-containing protein [Pseudoroseicyclus sp. CXY001]|uniref:TetR family transcriptional regulator C-terminal domain-containing protein n=1 Tax=Pseudoroseicyclus sp. CXY001 TaxID=3242492 RepID=UPI00358DC3CF